MLSSEVRKHSRQVYNVLDLLGDLGGVVEVVMVFFGIFLYPLSKHNFVLKAT